jgi:hypothetical protein
MASPRRTHEAWKNRPYYALTAGDLAEEVLAPELALVWDYMGTRASKVTQMMAGAGLTGGGSLAEDRTFEVGAGAGILVSADAVAVDQEADFDWLGTHRFQSDLSTSHLIPRVPDTYDIGSQQQPYRRAHISEIAATIFTKNEQTIHDAWFVVTKGSGKLNAAIDAVVTDVDLEGGGFAVGDRLIFRRVDEATLNPVFEVMTISVVPASGNVYSVTRGAEGSGADAWPEGQVFANYGKSGDGRIEMNSIAGAKQSIFQHGATAAGDAEVMRQGYLEAWDGAGLAGLWGMALGRWNAGNGPYMLYNQTDGLIVKGQIRADTGYLKDLSITGVLSIANTGFLRQGSGTWGTNFTGLAIYSSGGIGVLEGWKSGTKQAYFGSDGILYAGAGAASLKADGISIISPPIADMSDVTSANKLKFVTTTNVLTGSLYGGTKSGVNNMVLETVGTGSTLKISTSSGPILVSAGTSPNNVDVSLDTGYQAVLINKRLTVDGDAILLGMPGHLSYGAKSLNAYGDIVSHYGSIKASSLQKSNNDVLAHVQLINPITAASFNWTATSTIAKTAVNVTTQFPGVPSGVKSIDLMIGVRDSGSATVDCWVIVAPNTGNFVGDAVDCHPVNDRIHRAQRTVKVVNNLIYMQRNASGTGTLDVFIQCTGYEI